MLKTIRLIGGMALLGGLGGAHAVAAETYAYKVRHPFYGEIGSYTDKVDRTAGLWHIEGQLRVMVRILGIVLFREEADRSEVSQDGRLVSFHGITTTNGKAIEVTGEARSDGFAITSPSGTVVAPPDVVPSDPWFAKTGSGLIMSTKTGRLDPVQGVDHGTSVITVDGVELTARHFELISDKRQEVWLTEQGVPVRFRSYETGTAIDFELTSDTLRAIGAGAK